MNSRQTLIRGIAGLIVAGISGSVALWWRGGGDTDNSQPAPKAETVARMDSVETVRAAAQERRDSLREARRASHTKPRHVPERRNHLDEPIPTTPREKNE